jgi:GDP-L-fucose synthase
MSTLITGGFGLLGSSIDFGFKPTKEELNLLNYNDLKNFIIKNNIDSIIHTAAKVGGVKANSDYVYDFFADNILMNINVQNACKEFDIKKSIFIVSTCAFPSSASLPLKESYLHDGEPHETNFGYAYSKRMLEVGSRALKQQYQIDSTCVIPCNLYGENDNYNLENGHVIPSLIHRCYLAKINNTNFEIWGSGRAEREFIYVKDFAKIITQIFNYDINVQETMIISPETTFTIQEIVDIIVKKIGFQGKVIFDETKPEGILKKNSSNKIFRKYFPDFSFTDIDYGLEQTIQYFIKNYDLLRK